MERSAAILPQEQEQQAGAGSLVESLVIYHWPFFICHLATAPGVNLLNEK